MCPGGQEGLGERAANSAGMPEASSSIPKRVAELESLMGVRYLAAFLVLVTHMGWMGFTSSVPFFFVLSGFILTYKYVRDGVGLAVDVRTFWIARVSRIYPAYALALVLLAADRWWFGFDFAGNVGGLVGSSLMVSGWNPRQVYTWNTPGWTVTAEMFFYVCFPLIIGPVLRLRDRRGLFVAGALTWLAGLAMTWTVERHAADVVASHDWWHLFIGYAPIVHLPSFVTGVLLGRWHACWGGRSDAGRGALLSTSSLAVAFCLTAAPQTQHLHMYVHNTLLGPVFAVMIWGLVLGGGLAGPLSSRFMVVLGQASYAVYILQEPVISGFCRALGPQAFFGNPAWLPVFVLTLTWLGVVVYHRFEVPATRSMRVSLAFLVPKRPLSLGVARRESALALVAVALVIGLVSRLPQRHVVLSSTRLEHALALMGATPVAWVQGGDARYVTAYVERVSGIGFVAWARGRDVPLVLAPPHWSDGVHTRYVDSEVDGSVTLWSRPDVPLPPACRFVPTEEFGNRRVFLVREGGFHGEESDASGRTRRWTGGHAFLQLPPLSGFIPRHLEVRLAVARPTWLEVQMDGKSAWKGVVAPSERTLRVAVPPASPGSAMRLDLLSETFVPRDLHPSSGDTRRLGVSVLGMRLLP